MSQSIFFLNQVFQANKDKQEFILRDMISLQLFEGLLLMNPSEAASLATKQILCHS